MSRGSAAKLLPFDAFVQASRGGAAPEPRPSPQPPADDAPWLCPTCGEHVRVRSNVAAHEASHGRR